MQQTIEIIDRILKAYNTQIKSDRGLKKIIVGVEFLLSF